MSNPAMMQQVMGALGGGAGGSGGGGGLASLLQNPAMMQMCVAAASVPLPWSVGAIELADCLRLLACDQAGRNRRCRTRR